MSEKDYTTNDILLKLYNKHSTWLLMANKLTPLYYSITAEDIVQDMYIKIYEKIRDKKLKKTDIMVKGKVNAGVVYITMHDMTVDIHRKKESYYPIKKDIKQDNQRTEAEFFERIDKVVDNFNWFYKKIFKLYTEEFQSMRKLSNATKISYKTVYNKIKICKDEIKKQLNNGK